MPSYWFIYNGGSNIDPLSYTKVNQQPNCPGLGDLCSIFATAQTISGVIRPIISGTPLQTEIPVAVNTNTPTTAVLLKP